MWEETKITVKGDGDAVAKVACHYGCRESMREIKDRMDTVYAHTNGLFLLVAGLSVLMVLFILAQMLTGCVTFTHPDGTVEQRLDPAALELARLSLDLAVTAYNAYRADTGSEARPDRLTQLLDNVERAEEIYNRWADLLDRPRVRAVDQGGQLTTEEV